MGDSTHIQNPLKWEVSTSPIRERPFISLFVKVTAKDGEDDYISAARLGPPNANGVFKVEWLCSPSEKAIIKSVESDLDYYLLELPQERIDRMDPLESEMLNSPENDFADDVWQYLKYHCGTAATIYSSVLWRYRATDDEIKNNEKAKQERKKEVQRHAFLSRLKSLPSQFLIATTLYAALLMFTPNAFTPMAFLIMTAMIWFLKKSTIKAQNSARINLKKQWPYEALSLLLTGAFFLHLLLLIISIGFMIN